MWYCSGFEMMVPYEPVCPLGFTHAAMVNPCPAIVADADPPYMNAPLVYHACCAIPVWKTGLPAFRAVSIAVMLSRRLPSNLHQRSRPPGTDGSATHTGELGPTAYSTIFVAELPARSVAVTANVW